MSREKIKQPKSGVIETAHLSTDLKEYGKNYDKIAWGASKKKEIKCKRCNDSKEIYLTKVEVVGTDKKAGMNPCPDCCEVEK